MNDILFCENYSIVNDGDHDLYDVNNLPVSSFETSEIVFTNKNKMILESPVEKSTKNSKTEAF